VREPRQHQTNVRAGTTWFRPRPRIRATPVDFTSSPNFCLNRFSQLIFFVANSQSSASQSGLTNPEVVKMVDTKMQSSSYRSHKKTAADLSLFEKLDIVPAILTVCELPSLFIPELSIKLISGLDI
jgi:hypothetical protein